MVRRLGMLSLVPLLVIACSTVAAPSPALSGSRSGQASPQAALQTMYLALASGDVEVIPSLVRAKNGGTLSAQQIQQVKAGSEQIIAAGPLHVSTVRVVTTLPLDATAVSLLPSGTNAVRATFDVEGTGNTCLRLPLRHAEAPLAQINGDWYVLEDVAFGLPFGSPLHC